MVKRRRFTSEFKARVVLEILSGAKTQAEVAREHRIKADLLLRWKRQFLENASSIFEKGQPDHEAEVRIAELEQALGVKQYLSVKLVLDSVESSTKGSRSAELFHNFELLLDHDQPRFYINFAGAKFVFFFL